MLARMGDRPAASQVGELTRTRTRARRLGAESDGFGGGQSEQGYYGGGKLDGKEAPHEETVPIDKGRGASG